MISHENDIEFCFNKKKLIENYDGYKKIGTIYYPLKTNTNSMLLNALKEIMNEEDGFLISNTYNFEVLKELNVSPQKMCLINVVSTNDTIKNLYEKGVRQFVFDDFNTLKSFCSYAQLEECKIFIRLNTVEIFTDTIMHLGATIPECHKMLELIKDKCQKVGISFYLQGIIKNRENALEKILDCIYQNFNTSSLSFISIAGVKSSEEINVDYINKIKESLGLKEIILEPGKYLVGNTFDLLTKVVKTKEIKDKKIIIIKNGIYSGLLDLILYDEKFKLYFKNKENKYIKFSYIKDDKYNYEVYMCGSSADSKDIVGSLYIEEKYKDEIRVGNEILIKDVGSYFEVFFMPYGGDINIIYKEIE